MPSQKWSNDRERGIRQKTIRTLCRLQEQMADYPHASPAFLAEEIKQRTGWQKRKAYDYAKALVLIRRTEIDRDIRAKIPRQQLAQIALNKPARKKWIRSFKTEFMHLLEEASQRSRESEEALQDISPPPSIGFDNLTDMPFMNRTHIRVISLTCPYGKIETSCVACPYERFAEEPAKVAGCGDCPRKKYELPLSEWSAKVDMTVPSDDLPGFLSGLTKEIKNTLDDATQATP